MTGWLIRVFSHSGCILILVREQFNRKNFRSEIEQNTSTSNWRNYPGVKEATVIKEGKNCCCRTIPFLKNES